MITAAQIAQLLIILAPIAEKVTVEGARIYTEFKTNLTQKQINEALELSRSTNWPELSFGLDKGPTV